MGQEATKFLDLQQSIRRGPQNVVSNEISFQFCKTWDPSDVHDMLAMYTRIAKNDEDLSSLGHQLRQEALQDEIRRLKSLLSAIDDEEERFHATHPEGDQLSLEKVSPGDENTASDDTVSRGDDKLSRPKETTKSTSNITPLAQSEKEKKNACMQAAEEGYLTRRQEVSLDLERKERELQILQNTPSMEDVDFSLPVVWNLYFESIHKIDIESHSSAQTRARKQWHPATQGYSMERDPTADKLLKDYYEISRAPTPAEANQINEGHTDDNASISDDEKLDSDTEVVDKDILPEGRSEDKPPRTETLPLKDVIDTNTGLEKRTHTAVPPSYDPSIRSPVFFGYSTTLITKIETVNKETDLNQEEREEKYFEKLQAQSFHKLQEAMTSENGKMRALEERRNAQMEKRQREEKIRTNELEEARKEGLDPSDDFFRKAEDARLKSVAQEAKEDETYQTQKDSIMSRMSKAKEISEKEIKQVKDMRSPKNPVGALRRSFHVDKLKELHRSLDEAKADLDQALKTYDQTKNRSRVQVGQKESNVQQRAQLLFVEDQVKAAEKRVAFIIGQVEEDEFMLKRAEALIQLESTYYPSFDALAKCPNLLTQALALVIMCSGTPKQKLKFIFNAFIQNDSSQDISTGLSRSAFLHLIQSSFRALDQLGQLHLPSRLTTDVPCTDESYLRDIVLQVMGKSPFLTWYNFKRFTLDAIQRSKYLSTILRLRWKYEHISRFQQQNMTPLRQYECGIISASDLKYSMARVSVFSRSDLSLNKKELMHTRALAMGSNDPLKADYSRYLKLRRTKVLSNVVPLDHGCYKNLIVYRKEVAEKAAIRLQTMWRAKKGRQDATMAARKQAFYHAKGTALKEARLKVEQEWHALEAISQTTLDKMKFDAKIRMRQVKLRTKGLAFTRDEVLKVMIEEAVQDAFEEIDHRFREMEESAGYCPRMLRFDPLDTSHFSEIAKSLVAQVHAARFPSPGTAALLRSIAEKELKEKKEVPETVSVGVEPPETNVVPFVLNDMNKEKKKQSQIQNASMIKGLSRANAVLSPQEKRLWFQLICSNPPKNDWSNRLFFVCDGMTELKLAELLLELPSKRHAVEYVNVFRNAVGVYDRDALITDLMEHFRIHRGVESLADALIAIARSDIETLWSGDVKQLLSNEEIFLEKNVQEYYKSISGRLIRELKRRGQDVDFKQKIDVEARQKVSTETKKRALEAIATWKMAEHSLAFTRRQIGARKGEIAVQSYDRTLWSERLKRALMADVGENTYTEVINVCQDFLEVAKHVATQIIREFHLPDHEKSLMPLPIKFDMDGRNNDNIRNCVGRGLRFELHNIRFRVAVDDHGRFDGSDELAAKAASAECRNSSLFLPLMLLTPNVLVPLQCCIDYHGMRVVCSSKLPIERYDMSDTDSLQSQEKELVYGSENKGRTVVFHSKTLDSALARVNENLNLAAHCVRGSQDLTAKLINGAGDMQGYIGRDETFCLLKFRRMMPPEDPEETRHIEASTRGMSILWRQLRPALIKTNSAALSCDALSLFTHHTPDWEVQTDRVKNCTKRLLIEVIPCFARKMATREKYFTSPTFSLVRELHRHGINIRHLGLISRIIGTTRDMTRELSRGDIVHIQGEDYTVSESLTDIFSDRAFTVDRCFMGDSCQNIQIHKGTIRSQFSIRETLLVEMIKRPIANDDLRRAVGFPKATHGYITCSKAKKWDTAVSLEAWVCVDPSGRGIRAIVCHGRFTLAVLKNNLWGAWVNMNDIDVVVSGSPAIPDTWTHLVSTFDGTALQLYVNGGLYGDIDVQSEVNSQLERRKAKFQSKRKEIDDQEIKAKADCMKEVERECRSLYMTKEGKQIIKDISKKIVEDFEFKLRLKKRASQQAGLDEAQIKDGNQTKLSKSEIETLAKQQHMVQVYNQRILSITALYQNQRNDLNSKIEQELADEKSQDGRPFRIGCVGNTSSNTKFFVGAICHVAFYSRCINRDIVTRHYIRGTLDRAWTSDALFELSAAQFTQALEFAPNDRAMLSSFAVNICSALKYDLDHVRSQEMYKSKVSRAVEAFRTTENYEGCAEILRNLPKDVRFSDLFRETYACLNELNPRYWSRTSNVSLLELDKLPAQFFMSGETKSSSMVNLLREEIRTYADIIRRVIAEYPTNYGDGLTDLKWLLDLETDSAVVYFVLWLQAGEDSRRLDFTSVRDITEGDMDVITSSNRSCLAMRLDGSDIPCNQNLITSLCTGIELLDLSDIHHLTDESLKAISKTCSNLKAIYLTRCSLITDMGIEYLEKCQDVREIIVNYCGKLTDDSLMSIATHMRLTRVEAAFCLQFSAFNSFCQATISSALTTLDLSGCRRLSDEALMSIGTKFTRLTYLNLAYCDKITHRGIWAITHNCLELTYLNMEDMHLATDIVFTFDKGGDGRESVAKVVLSKLSKIVLANCTKLTDTGIGYLLHRARTMTSIDISGCNLTDQGVKHLTTSIFNGSVIGEQIRELDLSYCMSLTSESLCYIRDRCKQLVSLYLTGCVLLQDVEMVGLIKSCSKISVLGLGFCRELTDNVLITIADCLWLEALYINRCSKFTDVGVCALASQCTGLQSLNLSGCKRLTDSSIQSLNESCMKLIQLDVTFCPHVSKSVLSKFKTNRVRMDLRCDIDTNGNQDIDLPTAKTQEKLFRQQSEKFLVSQNESPDK
ncbi:hypothetical protein AeRB84_000674 [Aphanomyces euteiches]|nr:hypothetical protein AeRB84_000674 [Aphanomyces euteiches]